MCAILSAGIEGGKVNVRLDEDGSERWLTVGHFHVVFVEGAPPEVGNEQPKSGGGAGTGVNSTSSASTGNDAGEQVASAVNTDANDAGAGDKQGGNNNSDEADANAGGEGGTGGLRTNAFEDGAQSASEPNAMIDTKGVLSQESAKINVGNAVRDRACGQFFVVLRIYTALL
eukprot:6179450-Pleurochrysis_carterae.AAC.5